MSKKQSFGFTLLLTLIFCFVSAAAWAGDVLTWDAREDIDLNKTWTIKFSVPIKEQSVLPDNIYILNPAGKKTTVGVGLTGKDTVMVAPPAEGYSAGQTYTLYIDKNVQSITGNTMEQAVQMMFTIKDIKSILIGTWEMSYSGYSAKCLFNKDNSLYVNLLGSTYEGSYNVNNDQMSVSALGISINGTVQFNNDNEFTVTSASGKVAVFTRIE